MFLYNAVAVVKYFLFRIDLGNQVQTRPDIRAGKHPCAVAR